MKTIAVIGGGFSGTMIVYHLMNHDRLPPVDVLWFDDAGRFARGVAYSTPVDEHLLNVPAGGMTALPGQPDHFIDWLGQADRGGFYPRRRYGDYLRQFLDQALELAVKKGHRITRISERVTDLSDDLTVNGRHADAVILATGASQPRWPGPDPVPDDARLIANPYGVSFPEQLKQIKNAETIAILGTGLSAADAVMSLGHSGFSGKILCISRHGNWPVAHGLKKPWDWRRGIDALRPHSNNLWRAMPETLRGFCLRRIGYWNVIRHRMPRQCHAVLQQLRNSGRLEVIRGSVRAVQVNGKDIKILLERGELSCDAVINCLGFIGAGVLGDPLYKNLSQKGMLRISGNLLNPLPGSFRVSATLPLFVVGPPLFGHLIETSAVPELRVQAKKMADEIAASF